MEPRLLVVGVIAAVALPLSGIGAGTAHATSPGIDGRILFVKNSDNGSAEIFSIEPDGSDERQITDTPDVRESEPAWSPDGTKIAFVRDRAPGSSQVVSNVWIRDLETEEEFMLTSNERWHIDVASPDWAPGGAYVVLRWEGEIVAYNVANRQTYRTFVNPGGTIATQKNKAGGGSTPRWSPTGRELVFAGYRGRDLYTVQRNMGIKRIRRLDGWQTRPSWRPNGKWIVFQERDDRYDSSFDLFKMRKDGSRLQKIASDASYANWSPSGTRLAFQKARIDPETGKQALWIMTSDIDGRDRRAITKGVQPDWQSIFPGGCTARGTHSRDWIVGSHGDDVICTRGGADRIESRGGDDIIFAGGGNDVVRAGGGNDLVHG